MSDNQPLIQDQLGLPNIDLIESSEQAFNDAFLKAAKILHWHLEQFKAAIAVIPDFTEEPFNMAILGLFSKMCSHYYSYVLLETHHDRVGSQLLVEHLTEAAITLTYLMEEVDESLFSDYVSASARQARHLLIDVEEQLQKFANHPSLLLLKDKLETFITNQQVDAAPLSTYSEAYLWGTQEADTTAKRGAIIGLNFLSNPARQVSLKVTPASWLELELNYLSPLAKSSRTEAKPGIDFTCLRDAAHLCLHATQIVAEVINQQNVNSFNIESQQQSLNVLYEWFHHAHHIYQLRCNNNLTDR